MSDLNDEARSLFDAARSGYEPNEADSARVLRRVLLRAGAIAAVTSATSASAAASAPLAAGSASSGGAGLAFKAALWLAMGGAVGIGGYAISRVHLTTVGAGVARAPARAPSISTTGLSRAARVTARPAELTATAEELAPKERSAEFLPDTSPRKAVPPEASPPSPASSASSVEVDRGSLPANGSGISAIAAFPGAAASSADRPRAPDVSASALSVEARALAEVQRDLKEGKNAEALALVEVQQRHFAHGELQPERAAMKILALCAVGHVADARAAARLFLANSPRSPFAARIRASCAGE